MAFKITKEWIINLPEDFESRSEDEKLVFWTTGMTVIAAVFRIPDGNSKLELLNQIRQKMPENILETLVSTKGEIVGLGYTLVQKRKTKKDRLALYTFTASDNSCLQIAFYLDDPSELDWAKKIWEEIIYVPLEMP